MRRETQNVLLILLGGALLKLAFSGDYLRYVKPAHQWWMIGGGLAMLLLGAVAIWRDLRAGEAHPEDADVHHEHGHDHSGQRSSWLLLVPVLAVLFVAPPALGADSVSRSMGGNSRPFDPQSTEAYPPLPADKATPMPISEFLARAVWDDKKTLVDRTVTLRGFVAHQGENTFVARMVIGCCAADGYPVMVRLGGPAAGQLAEFKDDEWITATGQFVPGSATEKNRNVPELSVEEIVRAATPNDPYEY
jgi:uncharacterized repeat protein (TIGR03943 family)